MSVVRTVGGPQGSSLGVAGVTALSYQLCCPVAEELVRLQAGAALYQSRPPRGASPSRLPLGRAWRTCAAPAPSGWTGLDAPVPPCPAPPPRPTGEGSAEACLSGLELLFFKL